MDLSKHIYRFLVWRLKYIPNKNFIIILSVLIGITAGLAAILLKTLVHLIQELLTGSFENNVANYLFFLYPLAGILLTVAYKKYLNRGRIGSGIPNLLYSIAKKSSLVPKDTMYSQLFSSSLTVGFGGSVGLEAPIVTTGAALGSNLARLFHIGYKKRTLLVGCGAAAAIGAIFGAPIAGVIFVMEVLLLELTIPAFIPLLISSVTGALVSQILTGNEATFQFSSPDAFQLREVPFFIVLGVACGLSSIYLNSNLEAAAMLLRKLRNDWGRAVTGGLVLGLMIFLLPPLYGEGYEIINGLMQGDTHSLLDKSLFFNNVDNGWFVVLFAVIVILVKVFASAFTIASGGVGGVFAPSMFTGALTGFVVSSSINMLGVFGFQLSERNFVLVGMAGVMAGLLHAPLTAIFLIAEVTGGYQLIIPLMLASAISYLTSRYIQPLSHYTAELAKKGTIHFNNKDKAVLGVMKMNKLIEKDLVTVNVDGKLRDLVEAVSRSRRNLFPVVDSNQLFYGVVTLDDFREIMFKQNEYDRVSIKDLMQKPSQSVSLNETMESVMKKFDQSGYWNLPVLDETGRYMGFLSKSKIFSHYRGFLMRDSDASSKIID